MFGLSEGQAMARDERIARLIARATNDNAVDWERYLPAARKLMREFCMAHGPSRLGGGLLG